MRHRKSWAASSAVGTLNDGDVAALRVERGHHPPDRAVLARCVDALEHDEYRLLGFGPQLVLEIEKLACQARLFL